MKDIKQIAKEHATRSQFLSDFPHDFQSEVSGFIAGANYMKNDSFNLNELRHIAVNFSVNCQKGYEGDFDTWFKCLSEEWRKIANNNLQ